MDKTKTYISQGNTKMGKIPSVSLLPIQSCTMSVAGRDNLFCARLCYAAKLCRVRPGVHATWAHNLERWQNDPTGYFEDIRAFLKSEKPDKFRWHVAGDIPNGDYLAEMCLIADENPGTGFLSFTKAFKLFRKDMELPGNLSIVFSRWPGMPAPSDELAKRYVQSWFRPTGHVDKPGYTIPDDAYHCQGNCEACERCWTMAPGRSVVFDQH